MIGVIGATGKTGQYVVAGLVERGVAVRALVRNEQKAAAVLPAGVELVVGDLADVNAVRRTVAGVDKVYLAVGEAEDQEQLELRVVDEAAAAGVGHIVKVSVAKAGMDAAAGFAPWHGIVEQRLAEVGIPSTILRPNWFNQNFFAFAETIVSDGKFYASAGDGAIVPIDVRDIADVAVATLTEDGHEGADYDLTGPESLTFEQIAHSMAIAIGRPVSFASIPDADFRSALVGAGDDNSSGLGSLAPAWYADILIAMMRGIRAGKFAAVSTDAEKILGRPPRSFEDFARDHASVFIG